MIIHISGIPGSGKTTLGKTLEKIYGNRIIVYDTDSFIQHHNEAGKTLLELEKTSSIEEYRKAWIDILSNSIERFVELNKNRIIVFTGILNNFSPDDMIYRIDADYRFMLDVSLQEILRRYYMRVCDDEKLRTKEESSDFWNNLAEKNYSISSSKEIVNSYHRDIKWHTDNGYELMTDQSIIREIGRLIDTDQTINVDHDGGYYRLYVKYKNKYLSAKALLS